MMKSFLLNLKKNWFIVTYFITFISLMLYIIFVHGDKITQSFQIEKELQFKTQWHYMYENGVEGYTTSPGKIEKSNVRNLKLTNTIPKLEKNTYLIYKSMNSYTRVTIDDKVVFDNINPQLDNKWCTMKGIEYIDIELAPEDSGKKITIDSYSSVYKYLTNIGNVYIIDRGSFLITIIKDGYLTVMCLVVFVTVSFVLFAAWIILLVFFKENTRELLYLGLFNLSVALWLATESAIIQYIFHGSKTMMFIAFEMLIIMPIPMILYCSNITVRTKSVRSYKYMLIALMVWFWISNGLHLLHIVPLTDSLSFTQLLLGISIIYVGYFQITEYVYIKRNSTTFDSKLRRLPIVGISILAPMAILEISKYTFMERSEAHNGVFLSIGLAVYTCTLAMDTVSQNSLKSAKYKESSNMKTQFLANMSHEIRTPINAMLGFNEAIIQATDDEKVLQYSENIQQSGEYLKHIINSILDISKIEAGKLEIYSIEYNMLNMMDMLTSVMEELAEKKGLTLNTYIDPSIPEKVIGDEQHLKQVLTNIMSNAVKYTDKGSITLTAKLIDVDEKKSTCRILFSVKDTGKGIKEDDQAKLFEKFERIGADKNTSIEGTGLGMTIVLQTLMAMGSEIKLKSEYGKGSEFFFELTQTTVNCDQIGDFEERRKQLKAGRIHNNKFAAPDAKILVVDDVEMNLDAIKAILETTRMQIDTALSGKIALEKVQSEEYDLIFMDHMMPEMDGIETTQRIRNLAHELENQYFAAVPIVALTANAMVGIKEHLQEAGMQDYVSKPIELPILMKTLANWLPKEKLVPVDDTQSNEVASDDEWSIQIPEIEMQEAKKYNASFKGFEKNLANFYRAYRDNRQEIDGYANDGDINNYVIKVHGLKSTSKMIGAMELSNKALELEAKGNEGQMSLEETAILFELYEKAITAIGDYLGLGNESEEDSDVGGECISDEDYQALIERIKKAADAFDAMEFMTLDEEMADIKVSSDKEEEFKQLTKYVTNMSFGEVSEYFK